MPSIEWNQQMWGASHLWPAHGGEWSAAWGDVRTQWYATIYPRISNLLPAATILEIGPGHGRWTPYLVELCDNYVGVDVTEACIQACGARFSTVEKAKFFLNDGKSLPMIADNAVDFAFSFDSLVHVEANVIEAYVLELSRVLAPDGIAFIHHSNLGAHYSGLVVARLLEKTVGRVPVARQALARLEIIDWTAARAKSMTGKRFVETCKKAGLACIGQEIVGTGTISGKMIDCISLATKPGSRWERANVVVDNPNFIAEALSAQRIAAVYGSLQQEGTAEQNARLNGQRGS